MSAPSTPLSRLLALAVVGLIAVAVQLGQIDDGPWRSRRQAVPQRRAVTHECLPSPTSGPYFSLLQLETGKVERFPVGKREASEFSVCSPWRDGLNRMHLVAQWHGQDESGAWTTGLVRYARPDGKLLDRLPLEVTPRGPCCWSPDLSATVLFAGVDGRLYRLSFGSGGDPVRAGGGNLRPYPLIWRTRLPGATVLRIMDPGWSLDPRLGRTVVVSMAIREGTDYMSDPELPQLWWLRLSADGVAIEGAGRLLRSAFGGSAEPILEERFPRIAATPDGGLTLAYLVRPKGHTDLQLRMAPVVFDEKAGILPVDQSEVREMGEGLALHPPSFSPDGRWIYAVVKPDLEEVRAEAPPRVNRYSVLEALAQPPSANPSDQLHHNAATSLRKEFDLDVVRAVLGHSSPAVTEIYAEIDESS